ncbi:MAG: LamG-like jellyroll fold domain-containing protein [Sedimentisphaeraceae bacterium JB056]
MIFNRYILFAAILLFASQALPLAQYLLVTQPTEIEGVVLWLDADDLDGDGVASGAGEATLQDGGVSAWIDKSGNGNDAGQSIVSAMPGYSTGLINSHSAVTFDNEGQFLDIDLESDDYNKHTIFIVTQTGPLPMANNFGTLLAFNDGGVGLSNPNKRQPAIFLRDNNCLGLSYNDADGVHHSYNFPAFTGFGMVSICRGESDVEAYLNGELLYSDSFEQLPQDGNDSIGKNVLNSSTYKGEVAEIIVYNRPLKDYEFQQVSYYLQTKYALSTDYEEEFLVLTAKEKNWLEQSRKASLIELDEVLEPNSSNVVADNDHFGWPVAAMSGDNIVVHCQQNLSHYTPEYPWNATSNNQSIGIIMRSTDRGQTWQQPVYVRDIVSYSQGPNAGGMISIGSDSQGNIILKHSYYPYGGTLVSSDGGASWEHYNNAFSSLTTDRSNVGPRIVSHPIFGLLMFAANELDGPEYGSPLIHSIDHGQSWTDRYWIDVATSPKEPCGMVWDNNILLISREFSDMCSEDGRFQMMSQHLYQYSDNDTFDDIDFVTKRTNIRGNISPISGRQVWAHDTADVAMNPDNSRIEMLDSHRWGGGLGETGDALDTDKSSLNLWSIDPVSLLEGDSKWRFDGTLLNRDRSSHHGLGFADGLHPGGAVIDEINNMQHIFLYAGFSDRRAAIYKLSRSLDTERLRRWLLGTYSTEWNFDDSTIVDDDSGYELNLQIEGDVSYTKGSDTYGASTAVIFDSTDNCGSFTGADNDFFDFEANDSFTLEVICKTSNDGPIISKDSAAGNGWQLAIENGKVSFVLSDGTHQSSVASGINVSDNTWHHIAAVRDKGHLLIYVDYIVQAFGEDMTNLLDNDEDLLVGASNVSRAKFVGAIDWLKMSRVSLTSSQFRMPADYSIEESILQPVFAFDGSYNAQQNAKVSCWLDSSAKGNANNSYATAGFLPDAESTVFENNINLNTIVFDGNSYMTVNGNEIFDSREMSWFIYFKANETVTKQWLLSANYDDRGDGLSSPVLWGSFIEEGYLYSQSLTKNGILRNTGCPITDQWTLLSVVWDGDVLSQYVNGRLVGTVDSIDCEPFFNQKLTIGMSGDLLDGFDGRMLRIIAYNQALDQQQRVIVENQICDSQMMPYARTDINKDMQADYLDFKVMAENWLDGNCLPPHWCAGMDTNYDGNVSQIELEKLISEWLIQ